MHLVSNKEKVIEDNSYARQALLNSMIVAVLLVLAPAAALGKSMGQVWPVALMAGVIAAGTILGVRLHRKMNDAAVLVIPFTLAPNIPRGGTGRNFKKAA